MIEAVSENPAPAPAAPVAPAPPPAPLPARERRKHNGGGALGLAWVHGDFHAAAFRRQNPSAGWSSPTPVRTLEEFAAALDRALEATQFNGTDAFLILGHEEFVHQTEIAPAFSESAARAYLRNRVERGLQEGESNLWVSQRAAAVKKDAAYLVHVLPGRFYYHLNEVLVARRLDLTRILPVLVPLQLALATLGEPADKPLLAAAETGDATTVLVGQPGGELYFARTTLVSWQSEAGRVAVEVNRSLLYAKQQYGTAIGRVHLLGGEAATAAIGEVQAKCGADKQVQARALSPLDWLRAAARLSPRHPINLVAGYLTQKRRQRFARRVIIGACWLGLALAAFDAWNGYQARRSEELRLAALRRDQTALEADRDRLGVRNLETSRHRAFVQQIVDGGLPPVPGKFLAYVASVLPREARLTEFTVKWDEATGAWSFHIEGMLDGDEETARAALVALRKQMTRGPLRVRFPDAGRSGSVAVRGGDTPLQRFALEGGLFED